MKFELINKVILFSLITAAICFGAASFLYDFYAGLALFLGSIWGIINLYFMKQVVFNMLAGQNKNNIKNLLLICVKWPLLYLAGYALLKTSLPALFLMVGFTLDFVVMIVLTLLRNFRKVRA